MMSPNLSLPYLAPQQAQKHVTHNEALRMLDALVQLAVLDRDLDVPPATPPDGGALDRPDRCPGRLVGSRNAGRGLAGRRLEFLRPRAGWIAFVVDEGVAVRWSGTDWQELAGSAQNPPMLGVNTVPDTAIAWRSSRMVSC